MSMDKSAIQEVATMAIAGIDAVEKAITNSPVSSIPAVALPKDMIIHQLEHLLPSRTRFRGKFQTSQIKEFAAYFEQQAEETTVFVDEDNMAAYAFFNMGTAEEPGHCDHQAILALRKTAPFKALLAVNAQKISQKSLAEWVEDWRDYISCHEIIGGPVLNIATAIASIRKVTIAAQAEKQTTVGNLSAERSDFERIEAKGDALPSFLAFKCEPYQSLPEREFTVRIAIHTDGNAPSFTLHIIRNELQEQEISQDLAKCLAAALPESSNILVGTFKA